MSDYEDQKPDWQPNPEDFLPSPPKPVGPLNKIPPYASLRPTMVLWGICAWVTYANWQSEGGAGYWVSGKSLFVEGEYWRLLTAVFAHSGIPHLLANTPMLLIFGWLLRSWFGLRTFPLVALGIGVLTNLFTVWYYPAEVRLLGASGMVYGMVSLWLVLYIRFDIDHRIGMRVARSVAFSLVVMFPTQLTPTTSYFAHAVGFGLGALLGLMPNLRPIVLESKSET